MARARVDVDFLNVHTQNFQSSPVIEVLKKGDLVEVFATEQSPVSATMWAKCKTPSGRVGWLARRYLDFGTQPQPVPPPADLPPLPDVEPPTPQGYPSEPIGVPTSTGFDARWLAIMVGAAMLILGLLYKAWALPVSPLFH